MLARRGTVCAVAGMGGTGGTAGRRQTAGRRRWPALPLAAALTLFLLTACTGTGGDAPASVTRSAASGPASGSVPAATPATTQDPDAPITLSFGGDVHFANQVANLLDDPATSMASLRPRLARSDLAMVNLETAITSRGSEQPKQFHFRTTPAALTALQSTGVDVMTMANNHAVDYGKAGFTDTLAARKRSPIPIVGIGANAKEAYAPAYLTVRGQTVAVLGATQVPDWTLAHWSAGTTSPGVASARTPAQLVKAVRKAKQRADLVVVYLHWGTDYTTCPNALQKSTAKALANAGAGLIVGAHAHRLMGAGWMGSTYVDYGLGNFVWWRRNSVPDATTGVLSVSFDPKAAKVTTASWVPMMVTASGIPAVKTGAEGKRLLSNWNAARTCTGLAARPGQ